MKHLIKTFILAALLLCSSGTFYAQSNVWNGWSGTPDYSIPVYRSGRVGVGNYCYTNLTNTSAFEVNQSDDTRWSAFLYNGGGGGQGLRIKGAYWTYATPLLQIEANSGSGDQYAQDNIRFIVQANGNVGIGTPLTYNPNNYLLAVDGTIGAQAVKIENTSTTWPDYVFDKTYKLMPLADVEKYIKTNKHLPDVSSEADIKKNGIDVAETDKQLLRKTEELTLYTIALEKRIKELEARTPGLAQNAGIAGGESTENLILKMLAGVLAVWAFAIFVRRKNMKLNAPNTNH